MSPVFILFSEATFNAILRTQSRLQILLKFREISLTAIVCTCLLTCGCDGGYLGAVPRHELAREAHGYMVELQTNLREAYVKFYNHGEGPFHI